MTRYKVTIHEHVIYDTFIEAPSQALAIEAVEEQIVIEDKAQWVEDVMAGWSDIGDVEVLNEG